MQEMVLSYLHGLMLLRKGMRAANDSLIYCAKNKLSLLFFGRNHPKYQRLIAHEKRIEELMPDEIKSSKFSSLVLSRTNSTGHYQSGDALIEEINKEAKRDVVGVPDENQWRRSFRNLDNMNLLREATFCDAGITDTKGISSREKKDKYREVMMIRTMIRKSEYLREPRECSQHTDILKSTKLSKHLVNFSAIAKKNISDYIPSLLRDEMYKKHVVYATEEEQIESERIPMTHFIGRILRAQT